MIYDRFPGSENAENATTERDGIMSKYDKAKLDTIEAGANNYTHPDTHPYSMITGAPTSLPANGGNADTVDGKHASDFATAEQGVKADSALNDAKTYVDTKLSELSGGASAALDTIKELAAALGDDPNFAATITTELSKKATKDLATTTSDGLMSAADKTKLAGISVGANNYTHPATHPYSMITGAPTSMPANGGNADTVDGKHAEAFSLTSHSHNYNTINGVPDLTQYILKSEIGNYINTLIQGGTVSMVKRVLRGNISLDDGFTNINIPNVNPSKCHVTVYGSGGYQFDGTYESTYSKPVTVNSLTSTILSLNCPANDRSGGYSISVSWEIVEFY
jgi:hypothetical protein